MNAQPLACVSAASFLAVLRIKDFPVYVYGLAPYGQYGVGCYLMDGVTPKYRFNLCREDGVVHLINFLNRLEQHPWELRERFENVQTELLERARTVEDGRAALSWPGRSMYS
ncbi:hypothetical protein LXA43DRAFT_893045 [Ganoderma leucocontextum]|nr:hypothetical protein LXA43DRAFT_893045 [Ganoderma leucocontextum]